MSVKWKNLYDLESIDPSLREEVGDKAIALSQLLQQGYAVPPGMVVGSYCLTAILSDISDTSEARGLSVLTQFDCDLDDYQSLQKISERLCQKILEISLPEAWCEQLYQQLSPWQRFGVIVRPCLVLPPQQPPVSGLLQSYSCRCHPDEMAYGIKQVWQSLFRARSLFYWQKQGIAWEQLGLAVLIQPLYRAIASGILDLNHQLWQIRAVSGFGHSLVRGEVLPDTYEINPLTQQVQCHQPGHQTRIYDLDETDPDSLFKVTSLPEKATTTVLTSEQLSQLIQLANHLQATTHQPFSCEWIWATMENSDAKLYLTDFTSHQPLVKQQPPSQPPNSNVIVKGIGAAKGRVTGRVYLAGDNEHSFSDGNILVTPSVTLNTLPLMKSAAGLVTEQGGKTSHGAILARELNIPAVVGAKGAMEALQGKGDVTIDGDRGEVYFVSETDGAVTESQPSQQQPHWDKTPLATQLMVNLSQRDRSNEIAKQPVDGVGLLRSELMLLELLQEKSLSRWLSPSHKNEFIQQLAIRLGEVTQAFFPRPVFFRSTDWLSVEQQDANFVGQRGTYRYVQDSELFSAQMLALRQLQHQGYTNLNLILPFVRSVEEVQFCQRLLQQVGIDESCQVWIMAEVPSVLYLLDQYIEAGIAGIAIGTNDLTQLLLGVDRDQGEFREQFNERHPAMLAVLKALIEKARERGIACSICGQAVVLYPDLVKALVRWGITSISVEESGIETVYHAIAQAEKQLLLDAARQQLNL